MRLLVGDTFGPLPCARKGLKSNASPGAISGQCLPLSSQRDGASPFTVAVSYEPRRSWKAPSVLCVRPSTSNPPTAAEEASSATTALAPPHAASWREAAPTRNDASWCQGKPVPIKGCFVLTWSTAQRGRATPATRLARNSSAGFLRSAAKVRLPLLGPVSLRKTPGATAGSRLRPEADCTSQKTPPTRALAVRCAPRASSASVAACSAATSAPLSAPRTCSHPSAA